MSWEEVLENIEDNNVFKKYSIKFFIPDQISVKEYFNNFMVLLNHNDYGPEYMTYSLRSYVRLLQLIPAEMPDDVLEQLDNEIGFPEIFSMKFAAGYPDIVCWIRRDEKNSKIYYTSLKDENLPDLNNIELKFDFYWKIINEYREKVNPILECTERYKQFEKEQELKYPKKEFDNMGRMIKRISIFEGFEYIEEFSYNDLDQITNVDVFAENNYYGKYETTPQKTYEYDKTGLLLYFVEYSAPNNVTRELKYETSYSDNGNLISRIGPKKEKYKYKTTHLVFKYSGNYVEILEFLDHIDEILLIETVKKEDLIHILNSYSGIEIYNDQIT